MTAINIQGSSVQDARSTDNINLRQGILGPLLRINSLMVKASINGMMASSTLASSDTISFRETPSFIIPMDRLLLDNGKMGIIKSSNKYLLLIKHKS
jgi:hypothetical protein